MTPAITAVRMSGAARRAELPLLVLGPAPGTSASALWTDCAAGLRDAFDVLAWDLPGHGHNTAVPEEPVTLAELAAGVLAVVDDVCEQRGKAGGPFLYAGVALGGAVGLQLLLDVPDRVGGVVAMGLDAPPPDQLRHDRLQVLDGLGPSAPMEQPEVVARLVREHLLDEEPADEGLDDRARALVVLAARLARGERVDGPDAGAVRAILAQEGLGPAGEGVGAV